MGKIKGKELRKGKRIAPPPPLPSTRNYDLEPPIFCFRYLDKTHGLDSCDKDEKAALVSTLYKLSPHCTVNGIPISDLCIVVMQAILIVS